ncbi:MAG: formylglycine-generating enzyme family protein [Alphaproteobacteria bacterium]
MSLNTPVMIDIAAADVPIGTPFEALDGLIADYGKLGVKIEWLRKESPLFHLRLERYRIAERPITRADFALYLRDNGRGDAASPPMGDQADHPALLSHAEATAYTEWLARETHHNFRLPTEFEWEFAAAGPKGRAYPWGDRFRTELANTHEAGRGATNPIGAAVDNVSWCGARDMAGNVEEWTSSLYRPYPGGSAVHDNFNADGQDYFVTRGGSYQQSRDAARCQRRHGAFPDAAVGLRLAESLTA